nr:MAG TPA: hypothetical protein [Caudoviricetes sp.]
MLFLPPTPSPFQSTFSGTPYALLCGCYSRKYSIDTPKYSARILSLSILGLLLPDFQSVNVDLVIPVSKDTL